MATIEVGDCKTPQVTPRQAIHLLWRQILQPLSEGERLVVASNLLRDIAGELRGFDMKAEPSWIDRVADDFRREGEWQLCDAGRRAVSSINEPRRQEK
jgi:hypothetical protein